MTGPRDEDLDQAVEDDRLHEAFYGFALNTPRDDERDEDQDDEEHGGES